MPGVGLILAPLLLQVLSYMSQLLVTLPFLGKHKNKYLSIFFFLFFILV